MGEIRVYLVQKFLIVMLYNVAIIIFQLLINEVSFRASLFVEWPSKEIKFRSSHPELFYLKAVLENSG